MIAAHDEVRTGLRLEGLAIMVLCVILYGYYGAGWVLFAVLFLAPDLTMLGYLASPAVGARTYNLGHLYAGPIVFWFAGAFVDLRILTAIAFVWGAHIGFDRALGYGLKYPSSFADTHLGRLGQSARS